MVQTRITSKKQNIQVFLDKFNKKDCELIALKNKDKAFNILHSVKSIFSKADIEVNHVEKHHRPFWHLKAESYMEYKRKTPYSFSVKPEVQTVTLYGKTIEVDGDSLTCHIEGTDHCVEHYEKEIVVDATPNKEKGLKKYLSCKSRKIKETEELMGKDSVVVPAEIRASRVQRH